MLVILPPVILNSAFMPAEPPSKGMNRLQAVHPQSQLNVLAAALRGVRDSLAHEQGGRPESEIDRRSSTPLPTPEPDPPYPLLALHPLSPSPSPEGKSGSHPPRFRVPPQQASTATAPIPPPFSYRPSRHAHDARSETPDSCRRAPSHVWTTSASSAPQPPGPLLTSEGGRWLFVPPPKPACRPGIRPLSLVIPSLYPSHWDTPGSQDPIAQLLQGAFGMLFPPCPLTPTWSEGEGDVLREGGGMWTLMARHYLGSAIYDAVFASPKYLDWSTPTADGEVLSGGDVVARGGESAEVQGGRTQREDRRNRRRRQTSRATNDHADRHRQQDRPPLSRPRGRDPNVPSQSRTGNRSGSRSPSQALSHGGYGERERQRQTQRPRPPALNIAAIQATVGPVIHTAPLLYHHQPPLPVVHHGFPFPARQGTTLQMGFVDHYPLPTHAQVQAFHHVHPLHGHTYDPASYYYHPATAHEASFPRHLDPRIPRTPIHSDFGHARRLL